MQRTVGVRGTLERGGAGSTMSGRGKKTMVAFAAGATSGTCSTLLFQPFDLVKTRMQVRSLVPSATAIISTRAVPAASTNVTLNMFETFAHVIKGENFTGLWKGTSASLQRCVPSIGTYFASLHFLKSTIGKTDGTITGLQSFAVGFTARSMAAATFLPFTVVKTRYESGCFDYRSVFHALRNIWHNEGFRGLFSGMFATLARDAPFSAFYFLFYTQSKQTVMRVTGQSELPSKWSLPCGVVAGVLASVATQPADVVKTRMQLQPHLYSGTVSTFVAVVQRDTVRGLFSGFTPRAMRRTLMASFTWAFFERIHHIIQQRFDE